MEKIIILISVIFIIIIIGIILYFKHSAQQKRYRTSAAIAQGHQLSKHQALQRFGRNNVLTTGWGLQRPNRQPLPVKKVPMSVLGAKTVKVPITTVLDQGIYQGMGGRPLVIENKVKTGNIILVDEATWTDYPLSNKIKEELQNTTIEEKKDFIKHWLNSGIYEHASIASFAQVILELTKFGAPEHLISGATRAMNDEIKHTKIALSLAQLFNKTKQFSISEINLKPQLRNIKEFIKDNYRDAIINESKAAEDLFKQSAKEKENNRPELSKLINEIGLDETRHAQLGVNIEKWAKNLN